MDRDARVRVPVRGDVVGGKYRVDGVLGRGGMSVVYRATHVALDRPVALKVLSPDALGVPEYVARLRHEARAVARIRSEHVARVFDVGEMEPDAVPFLVMELLTGRDLAGVLARRGRFSLELAITCILQVCEALAEAHATGLVHRDLKPANLFLTEAVDGSPCVKVLDFGISRMPNGLSPVTDPGIVLGTPSYMAPEQMEAGASVGPRSDIWALGAILYELLVGKPAYKGESLPQIFVTIMRAQPPRPSHARRDVPPEIDAVVARCLSIDPDDRYASVAELARALATATGDAATHDAAERIARVLARARAESRTASWPAGSRVSRAVAKRPVFVAATKRVAAAVGAMLLGAAMGFAVFEPRSSVAEPDGSRATPPRLEAPAPPRDRDAPPPILRVTAVDGPVVHAR